MYSNMHNWGLKSRLGSLLGLIACLAFVSDESCVYEASTKYADVYICKNLVML